ncbi:hypothetical protein [Methylocystis parvus]|uniref:hypothetical protein n=1 Tax=Methylocystis parvus TaxID=134 RepID=UPI003C754BFF
MAETSDIVERLRAAGGAECLAAADEIERLRRRRDDLPLRRDGETFETWFEGQLFRVTIGRFADARLAEIFIGAVKTTTLFDHLARDTGLLLSLALQHGATAQRLAQTVSRDSEGRPQGLAGHVLDAIDGGRNGVV